MNISYEKAKSAHQKFIFAWLEEAHVKEFWDNSPEHKADILDFINGRKGDSNYFYGAFTYWIASIDNQPYAMIMTIKESPGMDRDEIKNQHLAEIGRTYSIDYMIGNKDCYGKGLGVITLANFIDFFRQKIDPGANVFFIDPDVNNPKAMHVYEQAGFIHIGEFIMQEGAFAGKSTDFLIKKFEPKLEIIPATMKDYPALQNMARFYLYDLSRYCGFVSREWAMPEDGLYECFDFKRSFEEPDRQAYFIRVDGELAGFVLLHYRSPKYIVDEFCILAKFHGKGIAEQVAHRVWQMYPAKWELSVIPENKRSLGFWRKTITKFMNGKYLEEIRKIDYDKEQPRRYFFSFDSSE